MSLKGYIFCNDNIIGHMSISHQFAIMSLHAGQKYYHEMFIHRILQYRQLTLERAPGMAKIFQCTEVILFLVEINYKQTLGCQ